MQPAFAIYGDPLVVRHLHRDPTQTLEEQRDWLKGLIERNAAQPGGMGGWAIERKEDGSIVGTVLLKPLPEDTRIEVGWHLGSAYWGNGYATEAGEGALRHGFETLGLGEIFAVVAPLNEPSQRVCDRLEMSFIEMTERYYGMNLQLYRLGCNEWAASRRFGGQ